MKPFLPALLDPKSTVPVGLTDAAGHAAGSRFDVYRNNVSVSLTEALATGFPVIEKLVGEAFFTAMAGVFLRAHPPRSPVLARWGDAFPGTNQTFTPSSPQSVTFFVNLGAVPGTKQGDEYVFHSLNPPIVCGSFMSELGGSDWDQTDTSTTVMSDGDGDDAEDRAGFRQRARHAAPWYVQPQAVPGPASRDRG